MDNDSTEVLIEKAMAVLAENDRGSYTVPASELYPHQWLWDSCFVAIGLRHSGIERAKTEIRSLFRGQWDNGMLPNIIFNDGHQYRRDREIWQSYISPYAPKDVATSGLTQPPMAAIAIAKIGQKLKLPERRSWYQELFHQLVFYHQWLYAERDPHGEGLIVLLHPYESGLDSSPPWASELRKHSMPLWVSLIERLGLDGIINKVRRDTRHIPPGQRISNIEAMTHWAALHRLRRKAYNSEAILPRSLFAVEDILFNSILVAANEQLTEIARTVGRQLPEALINSMQKTQLAMEQLWDETTGQYFSRSFISHKLIEEPSIASLLPLFAGGLPPERAARIVELLSSDSYYKAKWPVPSVPIRSSYFDPLRYWQGPTWINTNWLIIEGLKTSGYKTEAESLKVKTLELVAKSGMNEYFSPVDGAPAGAPNFSWTAALTIDLLRS